MAFTIRQYGITTLGNAILRAINSGGDLINHTGSGDTQGVGNNRYVSLWDKTSWYTWDANGGIDGTQQLIGADSDGIARVDRFSWADGDNYLFLRDVAGVAQLYSTTIGGIENWSVSLPGTLTAPVALGGPAVTVSTWRIGRCSGETEQYAIASIFVSGQEYVYIYPFTAATGVAIVGGGFWLIDASIGLAATAHNHWHGWGGYYFSPGSGGTATTSQETYWIPWTGASITQIEPTGANWTHQSQFGDDLMYGLYSTGILIDRFPDGPTGARQNLLTIPRAEFLPYFETPNIGEWHIGYLHGELINGYAVASLKLFNAPAQESVLIAINTTSGEHAKVTEVPLYDDTDFYSSVRPSVSHLGNGVLRITWQGSIAGEISVFATDFGSETDIGEPDQPGAVTQDWNSFAMTNYTLSSTEIFCIAAYRLHTARFCLTICDAEGSLLEIGENNIVRLKIGRDEDIPILDITYRTPTANGSHISNTNPMYLYFAAADLDFAAGIYDMELLIMDDATGNRIAQLAHGIFVLLETQL